MGINLFFSYFISNEIVTRFPTTSSVKVNGEAMLALVLVLMSVTVRPGSIRT